MNKLAKYLPAAALGALLLIGGTSKASAVVIYSQDFTGGASTLAGTAPTVGTGLWTGNNIINLNGNSTGVGGAVSLAFTPSSGFVYDLSATINVTAVNGSWIGVGFLPNNATFGWFPSNPAALRTADWQIWPQAFNANVLTSNDVLIRLDTTGVQWTTSMYQGGTQIGSTYTYNTANPTINFVGFVSEGTAVGNVSAFQLTQAVPEPSTYALVLGGIATLLLIRRRVQA
jgi:hypothetical protein